jgi:triosephosphate isomerase
MVDVIIANWKMSLGRKESRDLAQDLLGLQIREGGLIICPSVLFTCDVGEVIADSVISLGSQDCANKQVDAYTGGVGVKHLRDIGCRYCIVGHSERRMLAYETAQEIHDKLVLLLEYGITPILCVGEDHISRKAGVTREVVLMQLEEIGFGIDWSKIIVAYEPVWAVGTGMIPTNSEISEVIEVIDSNVSPFKILYGGSVNKANISELNMIENLDGFLIGSASTKLDEIKDMLKITNNLI